MKRDQDNEGGRERERDRVTLCLPCVFGALMIWQTGMLNSL